MRFIAKGDGPDLLAEAVRDGCDWRHLRAEAKAAIRYDCFAEQHGLCGYCTGALADPGDAEIAHVEPRAVAPERELDYRNMILSCASRSHGAYPSCNEAQRDRPLPVSPLGEDCETAFDFDFTGQIRPAVRGDERARRTIEVLRLDCARLRQARAAALLQAELDLASGADVDDLRRQYMSLDLPTWTSFAPVVERAVLSQVA